MDKDLALEELKEAFARRKRERKNLVPVFVTTPSSVEITHEVSIIPAIGKIVPAGAVEAEEIVPADTVKAVKADEVISASAVEVAPADVIKAAKADEIAPAKEVEAAESETVEVAPAIPAAVVETAESETVEVASVDAVLVPTKEAVLAEKAALISEAEGIASVSEAEGIVPAGAIEAEEEAVPTATTEMAPEESQGNGLEASPVIILDSPEGSRPRKRRRGAEEGDGGQGQVKQPPPAPTVPIGTSCSGGESSSLRWPELTGLQAVSAYMKEFLTLPEREFMSQRGVQCQMGDALRSMARLSHYLSDFARRASGENSLGVTMIEDQAARLYDLLELEKAATSELSKELDLAEEALNDARETVDRRDDELRAAEQKILRLTAQKEEAERDYRRARDSMNRAERALSGRTGYASSRSAPARARSPGGEHRQRGASGSSSSRRDKTRSELSREVDQLKEELKDREEDVAQCLRRAGNAEEMVKVSERREDRLVAKAAEILNRACISAFSAGFDRCKKMTESFASAEDTASLLFNPLDEVLKGVTEDSIHSLWRLLATGAMPFRYKVNRSTQTDDDPNVDL